VKEVGVARRHNSEQQGKRYKAVKQVSLELTAHPEFSARLWCIMLMTPTASGIMPTTQLVQRQRFGPMATGRVWQRGCIGSTAYADVCHFERPLELIQPPKPPLTK